MQKGTSVLLGALVIVATGAVILWAGPRGASPPNQQGVASIGSTVRVALPALSTSPSAKGMVEALMPGMPGTRMLDGREPPALSLDAPRVVRFGVVLVQYRGAQRALVDTRTKLEALALAKQLAELASKDFRAAVDKGDPGSMEDAGTIPQGVLEPAPNYALFSLAEGAVSGPVDTPTGYWVLKHLAK